MEVTHAWKVLGLPPCDDPAAVRTAYARRLHALHPDRSDAPDAHDATLELNAAYRVVIDGLLGEPTPARPASAAASTAGSSPGWAPPPRSPSAPRRTSSFTTGHATSSGGTIVPVAMLADDTIGIGLPGYEAYSMTVDALHRLGEVTHDERGSGLLQVLVEFVDGPICQLLVTLQGRATGVTEIFCTIESIDDRPAPPIEAVTRLLLETLTAR